MGLYHLSFHTSKQARASVQNAISKAAAVSEVVYMQRLVFSSAGHYHTSMTTALRTFWRGYLHTVPSNHSAITFARSVHFV